MRQPDKFRFQGKLKLSVYGYDFEHLASGKKLSGQVVIELDKYPSD